MKFATLYLPLILLTFASLNIQLEASAYKGIFIMTFGMKSYKTFFGSVMKSLTQNGHKITYVGPFNFNFKNENFTEITIKEKYLGLFDNLFERNIPNEISLMLKHFPKECTNILEDSNVMEVLKEKYDYIILAMFYTECFWDFAYKSKVPLIYISPNELVSPYSSVVGAPEFASVYRHKFIPLSYPLSFKERILSSLGHLAWTGLVGEITRRIEKRCRERGLWSTDTPSVSELGKHVSLSILNSIGPLEMPVKPKPPNVVYAGGIHIKPKNSLPQDIEEWLNGSEEAGFILFTMGTAVKPQQMKKETLENILKVFRGLEQRIIWTWNSTEFENLPSNIMLRPFLPQKDILAHPKIRMFITHGGLLSLQEATYFGVPIVGIPVFADQKGNIEETVYEGWGRIVHYKNLTEHTFSSAIHDVLTNESIRRKAKERSILMRDWPTTPAEEVPYWVNYVVRHKGAKHLQSPFVNMSWYEIYNIDAWVFLLVSSTAIFVISYLLLKLSLTFVKRRTFKRKID